MPAVADEPVIVLSEQQNVILHRYQEARDYGFTMVEARLYAESGIDCGDLRRLVRVKCPPIVGAKILL